MRFAFAARHRASLVTCTFRAIGPTVAAGALITLRTDEALSARARAANRCAHTNRSDRIALARHTRHGHARQHTVRPIIIRNAFVTIDTCRKILPERVCERRRKKCKRNGKEERIDWVFFISKRRTVSESHALTVQFKQTPPPL